MGKNDAPLIECIHMDYSYPKNMNALYRATSTCGKTADILLTPNTDPKVIALVLAKIAPIDTSEFEFLLEKMSIKPDNLIRFFASNCQEAIDSMPVHLMIPTININQTDSILAFDWNITKVDNDSCGVLAFQSPVGHEILYDDFYKANKEVIENDLNLSKREIRKLFVVTKKAIKLYPRVSTKNTPIRGLYQGA